MNITTRLEKLLNEDSENENLVVALVEQQVNNHNVLAVIALLNAKNHAHWIIGSDAYVKIKDVLKNNLPLFKDDPFKYQLGELFKTAISSENFISEENINVCYEHLQNYISFLKDTGLASIHKGYKIEDYDPGPDSNF